MEDIYKKKSRISIHLQRIASISLYFWIIIFIMLAIACLNFDGETKLYLFAATLGSAFQAYFSWALLKGFAKIVENAEKSLEQ